MTTLKALRQLTGLSAPDIAKLTVGHLARAYAIEEASDLKLRSLYQYVATLGGKLKLTVELRGGTHELTQFDGLHPTGVLERYEGQRRFLKRQKVLDRKQRGELRALERVLG